LDIKEIKAIVDLMKRSSLTEFQLEEKDLKLKICRKGEEAPTIYQATTPAPFPIQTTGIAAVPSGAPAPAQQEPAAAAVDEKKLIKSPMVGTFYLAPSPESPPFVSIGDSVSDETVVCIIEAMKVMNEITAETKGKIAEVLIENGDNVEYGQPLFRLQ
jgi:acetyl-CoA carboxylase biotin carboxyl carrier protein